MYVAHSLKVILPILPSRLASDYLRMSELITRHGLKPVIEREFPLEQYEEALKLLESGGFVGKIVLKL